MQNVLCSLRAGLSTKQKRRLKVVNHTIMSPLDLWQARTAKAVKGLTNHFNWLSVDFPRKISKTKMSAMWLSEIYWRRVRRVMKRAELSLEIMKCCTENKEIWPSYSISWLTARSRKFPIPSDISRIFPHYYSLYNKIVYSDTNKDTDYTTTWLCLFYIWNLLNAAGFCHSHKNIEKTIIWTVWKGKNQATELLAL